MITEIGIVAGEIWHYLDQNGDTILPNLINGIGRERDIVLMSIGWLAREGHVVLEGEAPNMKVTLRVQVDKI